MNVASWIDNLVAYSLQIAVVVTAGTLLHVLFRLKPPAVLLAYWQALLAACLLLPLLQRWHPAVLPFVPNVPVAGVSIISPLTSHASGSGFTVPYRAVALVLAIGVALRLLWLLIGLARLGSYRRNARSVSAIPQAVLDAQSLVGAHADIYLSGEIDSPITFGIRRPTILFPTSFSEMPPHLQRPIACHELLHVRRRDWVAILVEDFVTSVLWFHPAIAWLLARIRLSREQVVDRNVVAVMGHRNHYLESLLRVAEMRKQSGPLPAPLFLRERHLVERVALLLKEANMSRTRVASSLAVMVLSILTTCRFAAAWFPLRAGYVGSPAVQNQRSAADQPAREPIRLDSTILQSKLITTVEPILPERAVAERVTGVVILQATVSQKGDVSDLTVLRGHPLLDQAAMDAVRQWKYSPTYLEGQPVSVIASVLVSFVPHPQPAFVTVDRSGTVRDPASGAVGDALVQKLKELSGSVRILAGSDVPLRTLEHVVRQLQEQGLQNLELRGAFLFRDGRLFYDVSGASNRGLVQLPEVWLDTARLAAIAQGSGRTEEIPRAGNGSRTLLYRVYINEVSEIVSVELLRGPKLPEVEAALARTTRVITPGRLGADAVPIAAAVEVVVAP